MSICAIVWNLRTKRIYEPFACLILKRIQLISKWILFNIIIILARSLHFTPPVYCILYKPDLHSIENDNIFSLSKRPGLFHSHEKKKGSKSQQKQMQPDCYYIFKAFTYLHSFTSLKWWIYFTVNKFISVLVMQLAKWMAPLQQ